MHIDSRDTTEFDQRAFFLTTAAHNPNNFVVLHNVNTSYGIFGQASYKVGQLTLTAGARQTHDAKSTRLVTPTASIAGVVTYGGRRFVKLTDSKPSWDLSALYEVSPQVSVYARAARGFRGPTIRAARRCSTRTSPPPPARPTPRSKPG